MGTLKGRYLHHQCHNLSMFLMMYYDAPVLQHQGSVRHGSYASHAGFLLAHTGTSAVPSLWPVLYLQLLVAIAAIDESAY